MSAFVSKAIDVPRFEDLSLYGLPGRKGLLLEGSRTSKRTNNNGSSYGYFVDAGDAVVSLVADPTAPVGGYALRVNAASATTTTIIKTTGAVGNTNQHTASIFTRGGAFTLKIGTATAGQAYSASAGWIRGTYTTTPAGTGGEVVFVVAAGQDVYFCLDGLEEAAFASSPIITAGSAVTRAADVLSRPVVMPSPASGWTYGWEFRIGAIDPSNTQYVGQFDIGNGASKIAIRRGANGNGLNVVVVENSVSLFSSSASGSLIIGLNRFFLRAQSNNWGWCLNGGTVTTNTSVVVPAGLSTERFGMNEGSVLQLFAHLLRTFGGPGLYDWLPPVPDAMLQRLSALT